MTQYRKKQLKELSLNFFGTNIGDIQGNLKYLADILQGLPTLKIFDLNIGDNNIGQNPENLKYLGQGIKGVYQLKKLNIGFHKNYLGFDDDNMRYLGEGLRELSQLEDLNLEFDFNFIGINRDALRYLGDALQGLSNNLRILGFNFQDNNFGKYNDNMQLLGKGLKNLNVLENLTIFLGANQLNENMENIVYLVDILEELKILSRLYLNFDNNELGQNLIYFRRCGERKQVLESVKKSLSNVQCRSLLAKFKDD